MIARLLRWTGGMVLTVILLLFVGAYWLVATESGTRWLLAMASPSLPDALSIEEVHGTLLSGLEFHDVGWRDAAATVDIADLATRFELMPLIRREVRINTLTIRNVVVSISERPPGKTNSESLGVDVPFTLRLEDASIENVRVAAEGNDYRIDRVRLSGDLSGSVLEIRRFDLRSELADVDLSGEAQLTGDYPLDASAAWELRIRDQPPLSGALDIRGNASRYEVEHDLDAPYAVATEGTLVLGDTGMTLKLANRWDRIRIAEGNFPAIELLDGNLTVAGTMDNLEFDGMTNLSSADIPATSVQTRGRYVGDRLDIRSLSVSNDWGQLRADGMLQLVAEPNWTFSLALSELNPAIVDPRLRGNLELVGDTTGQLVDKKPDLEMVVARIAGELNGQPVDGGGVFSYVNDRLTFEDVVVGMGDNRVSFEGSYGARLRVDARARLSSLNQLGAGIGGQLDGDFRIDSDLNQFAASGFINGEKLAWNGNVVDHLEANFELPAAGDGVVSLQVESAEQGRLSASLSGRLADEQWLGTINELAMFSEPAGEWTLREAADISITRSGLELDKTCLDTAVTGGLACLALDYDFSGPLRFKAGIDGLPAAALPRFVPQGARIRGEIHAKTQGGIADGRMNADASLQITGFGLIASLEGEDVAATFETASANAEIVDNRLVADFEFRLEDSADHASGKIEIADIFNQQSALTGQGKLALDDLSLLSFVAPDIANPLGKIYGSVNAAGSLLAPEISGEIGLRDGSADIRRVGISVAEVGLLVRQSKVGELSIQGSAKSGDGYLRINGETSFGAETGIRSELRLHGEDFPLMRLPDWQVTASPAITVVFDGRATRVGGELGIPEADITINTVPATTEKPSPDVVVHRGDSAIAQPGRVLFVDVTTTLGERVSFSGFGLTTGLDGSVRISGSSKSPYQGFGRVVLKEGRYQAYGQDLEIESGELIFNGPLNNPALNVRATRTASDETVAGIHVTGTPAQLRSQVYSEPALGDAEALSYLLTGRPLSSANSEEGDMLNQAAFALGLTSAGSVASRVRNQLGLETLGIQGGAENRQLVAGKRFGDRLFIEYAYGVVDTLGTLLLRYQLSRRLVVESRSGSVRNVDVVYSVKKP